MSSQEQLGPPALANVTQMLAALAPTHMSPHQGPQAPKAQDQRKPQHPQAPTDKTLPTWLGPRGAHLSYLPHQASDQPQPPTRPTPAKATPSQNQTKQKEEKGTTVCFPFC